MVPHPEDATMTKTPSYEDLEARGRREIAELHLFFEEWFTNVVPDESTHYARFEYVLNDAFKMVDANGRLSERPALLEELRAAHGCWQADAEARIWCDDVRLLQRDRGTALFSYREWQRVAGELRGRQASALFREDVAGTPNRLQWMHVHETWLPHDEPLPIDDDDDLGA